MFLLPICYSTAARLHQTNSGEFLSLSLSLSLALPSLAFGCELGGWLAGRQSRVVARVTEGSALCWVTCRGAGVQQARAPRSILRCPLTSEGNAADRLSKGTQAHQQIKHTPTAPFFSPEAIARRADRTQAKVTIDPPRNAKLLLKKRHVIANLAVFSKKNNFFAKNCNFVD
jgi:hypothetical protein